MVIFNNRKMKKALLYTLGLLLSLGSVLTACSSDDGASESVSNKIEAGKTYYMTVNAIRQADTRTLTEDNGSISATWESTDNIYVLDNGSSKGTLHPNVSATEAILGGEITSNMNVGLPWDVTLQFSRSSVSNDIYIDYSGQKGTLEDIAENYDYATAKATITKVEGTTISAAESVVFSNQQAIVRFTLTDDEDNNSLNVSSLRISATDLKETGDRTGDITIITPTSSSTNVLYAALSGISNTQVTLTAKAKVGDTYYVYRKNGVTFADGNFYDIPVQMRALTVGMSLTGIDPGYIGWVVGSNGMVYPAADAVPSDIIAVAMVAYVYKDNSGNIHGLAIALKDENENTVNYNTAADTNKSQVNGHSWKIPTVLDWKNMFIGCGNGASTEDAIHNYTCFNAKLASAGGDPICSGTTYWSSGGINTLFQESTATPNNGEGVLSCNVRACLSW